MKVMLKLVFVWLLLTSTSRGIELVVETLSGKVQGYSNGAARVFRGIPYAKPPVTGSFGRPSLRWKDPKPAESWAGVRTAFEDGAGCPQVCALPSIRGLTCPPTMSEDCLFLNVFTPLNATAVSKLPVLFFIHGGNFRQGYGGGALYNGTAFATRYNSILVSINYRLGALGFLFTNNTIRGNYGIKDQIMALQWVHDNIEQFGGDATKVSIFGQSAGAMSAGIHMMLKESEPLFSSTILQSNPFGIPYRTAKSFTPFAELMAQDIGCKMADYDECLQGADFTDIIVAQHKAQTDTKDNIHDILGLFVPWTPTVDGEFITEQPLVAWQNGRIHKKPLITGTVTEEAIVFVYEAFGKIMSLEEYEAMIALSFGEKHLVDINIHYPPPKDIEDYRNHSALVATDALFHCPIRNVTLEVSRKGFSSWNYLYGVQMNPSIDTPIWTVGPQSSPVCVEHVCHAEELGLTFYPDLAIMPPAKYTRAETELSKAVQGYWTSMARYGDPSIGNGRLPKWEMMVHRKDAYTSLVFKEPRPEPENDLFAVKCKFWDNTGYDWLENY